jgi:hypothetical protein
MITLVDILNIISFDLKSNTCKKIDPEHFTNFETENNFTSLFKILLYILKNNSEFEQENELDILKKTIQDNTFNSLLNIKKIYNMICIDLVNNEVILFLCGYFNINILIYCFQTKILRLFYLENELNLNKGIILIGLKKDIQTDKIGYQTVIEKNIFNFNDNIIQNLVNNNYMIPIGIIENKKFKISLLEENFEFLIQNNKINELVLNDDIFINTIELQDDEIYNKINIKKINKKFSKKRMIQDFLNIRK